MFVCTLTNFFYTAVAGFFAGILFVGIATAIMIKIERNKNDRKRAKYN